MKVVASILLSATALALGACGGGDDNNNASTTTGTTQTTTGTSTGTQTGDGASAKKKKKSGGGSKSAKKKSKGSSTGTQTSAPPQGTTTAPTKPSTFKTAKTVCQTFLPNQIRRDLKRDRTTKTKVAKKYSTGWPSDQRRKAYRGCLAGLNAQK
jgi:hypothetical protein